MHAHAMLLNDLAIAHFEWVGQMGWHNRTVLEALGMIASEVGEVSDESFAVPRSPKFGEELADVMLRIMDLAVDTGVDLDDAVACAELTWRNPTLHGCLAEIMVEVAACVNAERTRMDVVDDDFEKAMGRLARRVMGLALLESVDLSYEIKRKIKINAQRGTRGRRI